MKAVLIVLAALAAFALPGSPSQVLAENARLTVFVSILPQAYFLERIGGDRVHVEVLVGKGQSPHAYEPSPQQMARLHEARAWFLIGIPFERHLVQKLRPDGSGPVLVETQKGVPRRALERHDHDAHRHEGTGGHEEHGAGAPDPHIWMSPRLVKIQARNIFEALARIDAASREHYARNLQSFLRDLDRVDADIARSLAPVRGRKMYVFHPAFGYFADAYGLIQVPVEIEGKEPGARQLARLIDRAKRDRVRVIFVQPQFSRKSAEAVAKAIGGAVVPVNPLAKEYLANLESVASAVGQGLR
ncbi:MAG: zinc ABC transporter solute-binding protein [Syntrophaceae bacterium]|nr:zinc ABC transporter solute-binding protein [Syntrophaceae bacterium]